MRLEANQTQFPAKKWCQWHGIMTDDGPKDLVSGRTTLHLEPFTQVFGATMERSV